jgi:hypothetical protein
VFEKGSVMVGPDLDRMWDTSSIFQSRNVLQGWGQGGSPGRELSSSPLDLASALAIAGTNISADFRSVSGAGRASIGH